MNTDRKTRDELNALSKEVFGASSRWQKLVTKGYSKVVTEEVTEFVPDESKEGGGEERKTQVPVRTASGAFQSTTERHTVESVRELMVGLKAKREEYLALRKKAQEEAALAQKIQDAAGGSVG